VRGVAAHAHEHRHAAGSLRHGALDQFVDFVVVERR
jgi:hypothetical protein